MFPNSHEYLLTTFQLDVIRLVQPIPPLDGSSPSSPSNHVDIQCPLNAVRSQFPALLQASNLGQWQRLGSKRPNRVEVGLVDQSNFSTGRQVGSAPPNWSVALRTREGEAQLISSSAGRRE
jgi:hypothetical protein